MGLRDDFQAERLNLLMHIFCIVTRPGVSIAPGPPVTVERLRDATDEIRDSLLRLHNGEAAIGYLDEIYSVRQKQERLYREEISEHCLIIIWSLCLANGCKLVVSCLL